MRELSLFSGCGGGLLGTKLLSWDHIGYVEINDYCQKIIAQRIEDGIFPKAPIFGDIRTFINQGFAESYSGLVDVVTAGFPCQPFSVAGKQFGENDDRNLWPETISVIRIIRPRFAFLENVPGLLAHGYIRRIFGDLAESGFDVRWRVLSAAEMGAPHKRDRLWIVAHTNGKRGRQEQVSQPRGQDTAESGNDGKKEYVDDSAVDSLQKLSDHRKSRILQPRGSNWPSSSGISWWTVEPNVGRVADGIPNRTNRLKAIGNGQVPAVVKTAWQILTKT